MNKAMEYPCKDCDEDYCSGCVPIDEYHRQQRLNKIHHDNTDEVVCPWCGYEYSDSWDFDEDVSTYVCDKCEKTFEYARNRSIAYSTSRVESN